MKILPILTACILAGCAGPKDALIVKQFTLRDQETSNADDPMVKQEKLRRLYGAVSLAERKDRLGQYYTVLWNLPDAVGSKREIVLEYLQGKSGSRVKTMRRSLSPDAAEGIEEFGVIGNDYFDNGRVLAWKTSLLVDGKTVATKQSYLWE